MQSVIIKVNSEIGAGTRGSSLGIAALNNVAYQRKENIFTGKKILEVETVNDELYYKSSTPYANYIQYYQTVFQRIATTVAKEIKTGKRIIALSGDHSNAAAVVAGIRQAHPERKLGLLWVDAHADLHSPYTTPSGNIHGMPLGLILGLDNKERQINVPSSTTKRIWQELKDSVGNSPTPKVAYIALRDYEPQEDELAKELKIPRIGVNELKTQEQIEERVQALNRYFADCDEVYVSFDVDSMDCDKVSNGTGTPVPNGLSLPQTKALFSTLLEKMEKVKYFEITEINPLLDTFGNKMAEAAYEIFKIVANSFDGQSFHTNGTALNGSAAV